MALTLKLHFDKPINHNLILNPGDTFSLPKNNEYTLNPTKPGMATLYKVIPTNDKPGPTTRK